VISYKHFRERIKVLYDRGDPLICPTVPITYSSRIIWCLRQSKLSRRKKNERNAAPHSRSALVSSLV
jgi:hypothetical protein